MCLIVASPTGKAIPPAVLTHAYTSNSDGAGIAWLEDGLIHYKKGLDCPAFVKLGAEMTRPHIAHCRIASVGPRQPELTHPFPTNANGNGPLEGSAPRVLFQNGTYTQWEDKLIQALLAKRVSTIPPPPWSDTRALAVLVHYFGPNLLYLLGNSSRFAVFDATATKDKMVLMGDWHEKDGLFYSHQGSCAFHYTPVTHSHYPANQYGPTGRREISLRTTPPATPDTFDVWARFDSSGLEKFVEPTA